MTEEYEFNSDDDEVFYDSDGFVVDNNKNHHSDVEDESDDNHQSDSEADEDESSDNEEGSLPENVDASSSTSSSSFEYTGDNNLSQYIEDENDENIPLGQTTFAHSKHISVREEESDTKDAYSNFIGKLKAVHQEMYKIEMKTSHPVREVLLKKVIPQQKVIFYNPFLLILGYALFTKHPRNISKVILEDFEKNLNSRIKNMMKYPTFRYDIVRYYHLIQRIMLA